MEKLSFAWGLAPSAARTQVSLAEVGEGCTVSDADWTRSILSINNDSNPRAVAAVSTCLVRVRPSLVPKLLIRELLVSVARRLLQRHDTILTLPRITVHTCVTSRDFPPSLWHVSLTACFPCDGTPVSRCVTMDAILDARHVECSQVISIWDAGVVPAEQSVSDGMLPFNARRAEIGLYM